MTREELINQRATTCRHGGHCEWVACDKCNHYEPDALSQQPCEDCISRKDVHDMLENLPVTVENKWFNWLQKACIRLAELPSVIPKEKTGHCKDCKWWKDNDGVYRRGVGAESKCPINRKEVYEGNGYCFMFEPQESEVSE